MGDGPAGGLGYLGDRGAQVQQPRPGQFVGPALRLIHDRPARPWTVAALAEHAGVSRATFARRFSDLVGEPPMAYLTGCTAPVPASNGPQPA